MRHEHRTTRFRDVLKLWQISDQHRRVDDPRLGRQAKRLGRARAAHGDKAAFGHQGCIRQAAIAHARPQHDLGHTARQLVIDQRAHTHQKMAGQNLAPAGQNRIPEPGVQVVSEIPGGNVIVKEIQGNIPFCSGSGNPRSWGDGIPSWPFFRRPSAARLGASGNTGNEHRHTDHDKHLGQRCRSGGLTDRG